MVNDPPQVMMPAPFPSSGNRQHNHIHIDAPDMQSHDHRPDITALPAPSAETAMAPRESLGAIDIRLPLRSGDRSHRVVSS
nr:hypothetical protein ISGA_1952 [Gordonia sp. NB41Y]